MLPPFSPFLPEPPLPFFAGTEHGRRAPWLNSVLPARLWARLPLQAMHECREFPLVLLPFNLACWNAIQSNSGELQSPAATPRPAPG